MQELKVRVSTGRYTPIPAGRYSPELIGFCHALLSLDPKKRPSPESILQSSSAAKWLRVLPEPEPSRRWSDNGAPSALGAKMMSTIIVPRDLKQLPRVLPPASYDRPLASPKDPSPKSDLAADVISPKDQAPNVPRPPGLPTGAPRPPGLSALPQPKVAQPPAGYRAPMAPAAGLVGRPLPGPPPRRMGSENNLAAVPAYMRPGPRRVSVS